jgi:hypothetical protein
MHGRLSGALSLAHLHFDVRARRAAATRPCTLAQRRIVENADTRLQEKKSGAGQ